MEYLCRRCDKNTDLKGVVSNMLVEWEGTMRSDSWVMRGTLLDRNATDGSEMLAQKALEMIQDGEDIREVLRKLADSINSEGGDKDLNLEEASLDQWLPSLSSTSTQMSALQLPIDIQSTPITGITSLATSLKIFDMIGASDSRAHIPLELARDEIEETYILTNTTEMEGIQGPVGPEDLALIKQILEKSNDGTVAVSRISEEDRSLKTSQNLGNQIETGHHICDDGQASLGVEVIKYGQALSEPTTSSSSLGKLSAEILDDTTSQAVAQNSSKDPDTAPSAAGARLHTPDELDLQYERDIKDALKKLKERQIREFISRKDGLLSLKNDMLNQHQELELARRDLLTQAPTMSLGSVNALIKKISALSAVLERQRISFDSILWSCKGKCPDAEDTA